MLIFIASQCHRRLASWCLLFLLFCDGSVAFGSRQSEGDGNILKVNQFRSSTLRMNNTDEILLLLAERRLQAENQEADDVDDISTESTCDLCQGTTFMPGNIPNQNYMGPDFVGLTCQEWQDTILPSFSSGETCDALESFARDLYVMCCKLPIPRYQCEQNVHTLLESREDYNIAVPPVVDHEKPLVVTTDITYEYMENIDVMSGTATILVTVNMNWKDPRLAWTIDEETCADYINLWAGYGNQDTFIWVPDFDLLNAKEGFQGFPATLATILSDGTVDWTMTGSLTAMCSYHGLANIPFDTLGCQFLFGARSRQNANMVYYKHQNYETINVGITDMSYSEYIPVPEKFQKGYTWYFNTDYSQALYYNFYFRRAQKFYVVNILIPTIFFVYCSFCTFLLDVRVGERLGFCMALALVVVAQQIVTFGLIPVSNQMLWVDKFIAWSFYWVLFVLIQSVFVGFIFFLREDYNAKKKDDKLMNTSGGSRDDEITNESENVNAGRNNSEKETTNVTTFNDLSANSQKKNPWFHKFTTRRFDFVCLAFSIVSYSIFIALMLISNFNGYWVRKELPWDTSDTQYYTNPLPNNVPDSYGGDLSR